MTKARKYAAGGSVTEEMDDVARGDGGYENWASDYKAGDRADKVGDRPHTGNAPGYGLKFDPSGGMSPMPADPGKAVRPPPAKTKRKAVTRRPSVNMSDAMAKIEAHEARKRARDAAESGSDMPGYKDGGAVRGVGKALRGFRPAKYY